MRRVGFPYAATIERFDVRFRPELKRQVVLRYLDPAFVEQARSLAWISPPGLGKTMLAISIATKHFQLGATARFITGRPTVITSNKSPTEWAAIVQDASLARHWSIASCTTARCSTSEGPHGESKARC